MGNDPIIDNLDDIMNRMGGLWDAARVLLKPDGSSDYPAWEQLTDEGRHSFIKVMNQQGVASALGFSLGWAAAHDQHVKARRN